MTTTTDIRTLSAAEMEELVAWAAAEGWNPGLADAAAFRAADPEGFLGLFVDGEMVSGISAVAYGSDFGFIGLYICRPDMRGKGFGKAVWDAGMARLAGRTVGLDGVPAQVANYRSMGFEPAYKTYRFNGRLGHPIGSSIDIQPVTPDLFDAIENFDCRFFPETRPAFLREWLMAPRIALAAVEGDALRGYGVTRACHEGFKIGPLFAQDVKTAAALLAALARACGGGIHIDVPEVQEEFSRLLAQTGLARGFETTRMYRGPAPGFDLAGVFGVTTLELG